MAGEYTQPRFLEDPTYIHDQLQAELKKLEEERNRLAFFCGRDTLVVAILLGISFSIFKNEAPNFKGFDDTLLYLTLVGPEIVIAALIAVFSKEASQLYLQANNDHIQINEIKQSLEKDSD